MIFHQHLEIKRSHCANKQLQFSSKLTRIRGSEKMLHHIATNSGTPKEMEAL
jgi:hypothetical protein